MIFFALGESWPATALTGERPGAQTSALTLASRAWCVVLAVDFVWSFSYTLFPRRKEAPVATRDIR